MKASGILLAAAIALPASLTSAMPIEVTAYDDVEVNYPPSSGGLTTFVNGETSIIIESRDDGSGDAAGMKFDIKGVGDFDKLESASLLVDVNLFETAVSGGEQSFARVGALVTVGPDGLPITFTEINNGNTLAGFTEVTSLGILEVPFDLSNPTLNIYLEAALSTESNLDLFVLLSPSLNTPNLTTRIESIEGAALFANLPQFNVMAPALRLNFVPEPTSGLLFLTGSGLLLLARRRRA